MKVKLRRKPVKGRTITCNLLAIVIVFSVFSLLVTNVSIHTSNPLHGFTSSFGQLRYAHKYLPADVEAYLMDHLEALGWDVPTGEVSGCDIWKDESLTTKEVFQKMHGFHVDLGEYTKAVNQFKPIPNLMKTIRANGGNNGSHPICKTASIHPSGIQSLFPSKQLSLTTSGFVEPLLTPMRHPDFCLVGTSDEILMTIDYLVHDFEAMCSKLKPTSRLVLIDMGASFTYKINGGKAMIDLINTYKKFGFYFDHIYGFEANFQEPGMLFKDLLPVDLIPSYHWINTGVMAGKDDKMNPLYSIVDKFEEDDFVVVKLDIDTDEIEVPLANQLLADEKLHKLVDQFYFEHHVHMKEMKNWWGRHNHWRNAGSLKDTFELMNGLRNKGVPAHFWP